MSEEQLKAFIAKAKDDQTIQEKLKAAKNPEDVVGIAKEHGHEFTADQLNSKITELSEEDLEGVAGGVTDFCLWFSLILIIKPPAAVGAFYFFNYPKKPNNQPSIPGTINRHIY